MKVIGGYIVYPKFRRKLEKQAFKEIKVADGGRLGHFMKGQFTLHLEEIGENIDNCVIISPFRICLNKQIIPSDPVKTKKSSAQSFEKIISIKTRAVNNKEQFVYSDPEMNNVWTGTVNNNNTITLYKISIFAQWNTWFFTVRDWIIPFKKTARAIELKEMNVNAVPLSQHLASFISNPENLPCKIKSTKAKLVTNTGSLATIKWFDPSRDLGALITPDGKEARFSLRHIVNGKAAFRDKKKLLTLLPNQRIMVNAVLPKPPNLKTKFKYIAIGITV